MNQNISIRPSTNNPDPTGSHTYYVHTERTCIGAICLNPKTGLYYSTATESTQGTFEHALQQLIGPELGQEAASDLPPSTPPAGCDEWRSENGSIWYWDNETCTWERPLPNTAVLLGGQRLNKKDS